MNKIFAIGFALFAICFSVFAQGTRKFALETPASQKKQSVREIVVQESPSGSIQYLKYSLDGKHIFATDDDAAYMYETESGVFLKKIKKQSKSHRNADCYPDASAIAYIDKSNQPAVYNMNTAKTTILSSAIDAKYNDIYITVSPDGNYIAVGEESGKLHIYNAKTLKKNYLIDLKDKGVSLPSEFTFTPDSKKIAMIASGNDTQSRVVAIDLQGNILGSIETGAYSSNLTFSPNGNYFAVETKDSIVIYDFTYKTIKSKIYVSNAIGDLKFSPDNKFLFTVYGLSLHKFSLSGQLVSDIETSSIRLFCFNPYNTDEITIAFSSSICIYNFDGQIRGKIEGAGQASDTIFTPKTDIIYQVAGDYWYSIDKTFIPNIIHIQDVGYRKSTTNRGVLFSKAEGDENSKRYSLYFHSFSDNSVKKLSNFVFEKEPYIFENSDDTFFAIHIDKKVFIYDTKKTEKFSSYTTADSFYVYEKISPSHKFIVLENFGGNSSYIYNIKTGKVFETKSNYIVFSADDKYCAMSDRENYSGILVYDTISWNIIKRFGGVSFSAFSNSGKYFLTSGHAGDAYLYNFNTEKLIKKIETESISDLCFSSDDKRILVTTFGRILKNFSIATGELLSSTIVNENGDWLTYTPEGYFNGSESGIKNFVHVVNGMEVTGLDQLADVYYRPDLVAAKLRGEDISAQDGFVPLNSVIATGDAPVVQFTNTPASTKNQDVTVNFSVQDAGGGIGAVYVSLNGKVIQVQSGTRKFTLEGSNSATPQTHTGGKTVQFSHTVSLSAGENIIEAYATNEAGVIESRHAQTRIMWQGETAKPNLYVLAVGVNKYRDRSLWLNYSVPDAQSVLANFGGLKTSLYQNIYTSELLDGDVTRENIAAKFAELSPRVKSDDVFIFYVAGHGTAKNGDYYFIPSNFRYTDASAVLAQGISKTDILQFMSNIKAGKTVILLDTCNSGAFLNDSGTRGFEEKTAMERLVRATGQAVLMASSDTQSAMEGYEGHGVFTYVLLQALSGKADANRDGYTTLGELASYVEEQVSELSFQKWGYEQVPMKELRKQDFPLVGK